MSHKSNTQVSNTRVDWSDPQLESLLRRSEGWQLDNRGGYSPQDVTGLCSAGAARSAGQPCLYGNATSRWWCKPISLSGRVSRFVWTSTWARAFAPCGELVVEERKGQRDEDREKGAHLYWLHVR